MTSGSFGRVSVASITINRETRQRKDLGDLTSLKDSIFRLGLIHNIVVTHDNVLVSGERRLSSRKELGLTHINVQFAAEDADEDDLKLIELEENTKRSDLTWQEQNDALTEIYEIRKRRFPDAPIIAIAKQMGVDDSNLNAHLLVKEERKINPKLEGLATFKTARDTARAANERRAAADQVYISGRSRDIYHISFHEWARSYLGPKFDVIHCDFPYGINSQDSGINPSGYDDSLSAFSECCITLRDYLDRFCADQAHIIFWYSEKNRSLTDTYLTALKARGFIFDDLPLVWHKSDGSGIAPDPSRRPRRVYETAVFGWRGDRKLVHLKDNLVAAPGRGGDHPHEKSEEAMMHIMDMVVESNSRVFDPTCGSGSALCAAKRLGAREVVGLEIDKNMVDIAQYRLRQIA